MMEDKYEKSKIDITKIPPTIDVNFLDFIATWNNMLDELKKKDEETS